MAKKQSYTPPMGGDANLIQGAGFAAKNLMQPVGQGIIDQGNLRAQENKQRRQQVSKQADARMAAFMENMPQNIDIAKVPEQMRPEITNFLMDEKDNYFRNAQIAANAGPRSPQYAEAIQNMNTTMQKFQNLDNDLTKLYDTKKKTLEDFDLGSISNGTSADSKDFMTRLTTDEITLGINGESGRLALGDDGSMNMDNLPKMYYKDHKSAQSILTLNNQLYNNGRPMDAGQESIVRMQLQNIMDQGGIASVRSLATDDHIVPGGLGIDPDDYTPEELKKVVLDQYVNVMKTASQNGYQAIINEENRTDNRSVERSLNLAKKKKEAGIGQGTEEGKVTIKTDKGNITASTQSLDRAQGALDFINTINSGDISVLSGVEFEGGRVTNAVIVTQGHIDQNEDDAEMADHKGAIRIILSNKDEPVYIDPYDKNDMLYVAKQWISQYGQNEDTREILDIINNIKLDAGEELDITEDPYFMTSGLPAPPNQGPRRSNRQPSFIVR